MVYIVYIKIRDKEGGRRKCWSVFFYLYEPQSLVMVATGDIEGRGSPAVIQETVGNLTSMFGE